MNDKFKMLALQATLGTADFDTGRYYVATPEKMQLFAELIVQKCADIGERYADGNYEVPNQILEYFGMQEEEEE